MFIPVPPNYPTELRESNFVRMINCFTSDEISKIIELGEKNLSSAKLKDASSGDDTDSLSQLRKSKVSWLSPSAETYWIYNKLGDITAKINSTFEYDLRGFVDQLQYTVYEASGDHYTWHMDKGAVSRAPRKLSLVLQLSDPSEYQGGDLQFLYASEPYNAIKEKGSVYGFPSYIMHKVTPVFSGTRRTLVAWVSGPPFR